MSQPSQEIALKEATETAVAQFRNPSFQEQIELAVPEGVSARQLLRAAATAVLENPDLADPRLRPSLLQATLKCAADGLLPDGREAAFVQYGGRDPKVSYQPMIGGLRKIAADHGWTIITRVVFENDEFDPDFDTNRANHKQPRLGSPRGDAIGAYALATHRDGRRQLEIMDNSDIERVRKVSRAATVKGAPWVEWWERMAEKTVGKRLFKKLGMGASDKRVAGVLTALNEADPADALYEPDPETGYDDPQPAFLGHASPPPARAEDHPAAVGSSGSGESSNPQPEPVVLNEPTDEELDAAADKNGEEAPAENAEPTFSEGRFEGMTARQLWESGPRGQTYIRDWAVKNWPHEPMKSYLPGFLAEMDSQ